MEVMVAHKGTSHYRQYLELHRGKWRVTLAVPRDLHDILGTRLRRPLNTDSLELANRLKGPVLTELRTIIDNERRRRGSPKDTLILEALEFAAHRSRTNDPKELDDMDYMIEERATQIAGPPILETARGQLYDQNHMRTAMEYADIAFGRHTPIELHHENYLSQSFVKPRTIGDDKRAIKFLLRWCEMSDTKPMLQAFTRRIAHNFADALTNGELASEGAPSHPVTLQKYINRLSRYWKWLEEREYVEFNHWAGIKIPVPPTPYDERERPFTKDELTILLQGPADTPKLASLHDIMRIAALTGARLDPIVDLHVRDIIEREDGQGKKLLCFSFKPQKGESAPRLVPVHSKLKATIKRRTKGKRPDDDLFPEWPAPKKVESRRERSFKTSNAFTAYRRQEGVNHTVPGKRRALVNFHSFRRWFITEAERAGQPEHIIAAVVGHKREGMTLGLYSAGPNLDQAQRCVEAVKLPVK